MALFSVLSHKYIYICSTLQIYELAAQGRGRRQKRLFTEMHERSKEITLDMGLAGSVILIEQRVPDLLGMLVSEEAVSRGEGPIDFHACYGCRGMKKQGLPQDHWTGLRGVIFSRF